MKTATWIIITLTLIIILGLVYYYYCVCQKDTKEGFSNQSSANSAYSERPLIWLTPDDKYNEIGLDTQGSKLLIIDPLSEDNTKKYMIIKPKTVSYTKLLAPTNLYVNQAGSVDKDYNLTDPTSLIGNESEFWEEVNVPAGSTSGTNNNSPTATSSNVWRKYKITGFSDGEPILETDKDETTNPHATVSGTTDDPISFVWYTSTDGKPLAAADEDIHSLIYSPKPIYDFDETYLSQDFLKQASEDQKPTGWWCCSKDDKKVLISQISTDGSMHWNDYAQVTLSDSFPFAKANTLAEYAKANYGDSTLQRALFSALVDNENYNKSAALEPIIDTVFFDPLTYNFVQLEHVNGKVNTLVYDIGGNPSTYVNEPYSGDLKTVKPWAIVCNKNGVILYINPKDNVSSAYRLRISIFSPSTLPGQTTRSIFTLSYTSNVFLLDSSVELHKDVISRIKEDRSNNIAKQALLYFKDEDISIDKIDELRELLKGGSIEIDGKKTDVPMGSFSCIKDELKYFQFGSHPDDVSRCVIGDYKEYLEDEAKKKLAEGGITAPGDVVPDGGKTEGYKINVTDIPKEHLDDYYKWMWYWKSKKYEEHNGLRDMSDYILKSSVVPPVCPTCPSCPNTGVCTECGGKGGAGTQGTSNGKAVQSQEDADGDGVIDDVFGGINKVVSGTIDTAGNAASQITDSAGNVISKIGDQVGSAASALGEGSKSAIGQAYSAGKTAVGDAYGAGKTAVSDAYGAGKSTIGDIYQEAKNVGGDVADTAGDAADATGIPEYLGGEMDNAMIAQDNRRKRLENEGQAIQQQAYAQQFGGVYGRPMPGSITSGTSPNMVYGGSNMGTGVNTYVGVGGQQRVVNPSVSNMNYMGRLPAKGNDKYIPITSDFSAFGR